MSLGLSLVASANLSWLLVSFPGSQESCEGRSQRQLGLGEKRRGVFWGPLAHTGLCLQVCGPTSHRACGENMYAEGSCLLLGSHLQIDQPLPISPAPEALAAAVLLSLPISLTF